MVFECKLCNTKCDTLKRYERHCQTAKHLKLVATANTTFECECGKTYSHRTSLIRHQRKCNISNLSNNNANPSSNSSQPHTNIHNNYNNVNNYNTNKIKLNNPVFNFNIYLNEQCRDALCIEDFCNNIVNRLRTLKNSNSNIKVNFIDNRSTFDHILGDLRFMNSVQRPIQTYQGEIVQKSCNDWKTLSLDKLNHHVTGITNQVNWTKYANLPNPITSQDLLQNMMALKSATQIYPPLKYNDMNTLQRVTEIKHETKDNENDIHS